MRYDILGGGKESPIFLSDDVVDDLGVGGSFFDGRGGCGGGSEELSRERSCKFR